MGRLYAAGGGVLRGLLRRARGPGGRALRRRGLRRAGPAAGLPRALGGLRPGRGREPDPDAQRLKTVAVAADGPRTSPTERVADRAYTLYHSDGLELDAVPADAYDAVVSFDALSRIPFHATRYRLLEEFFRVLKCDGRASLAMGFGAFHGSVAGYRDDAQGTNRKYVDAEIPRKRPTVSGVREELRNMKTTELVKRARRDGVSPETIDAAAGAAARRVRWRTGTSTTRAASRTSGPGGPEFEHRRRRTRPAAANAGRAAARARRDVAVNASLLAVCVVGLAAHAADACAVASGCFALLGAFMAYAVYIALCAMKAYTVSVGNLPEPEHDRRPPTATPGHEAGLG
ncbi:hypothetical protein JL722_11310 [Aureococcus anophagefferens]|nr:hypothetical protein JL722_11310 [Aureococcus anophagefferens]